MSKFQNANANPWYVLMTLHGEQSGESSSVAAQKLHRRNCEIWNAWASQEFEIELESEGTKSDCHTIVEAENWPSPFSDVATKHKSEMMRRNGSNFEYPGLPKSQKELSFRNTIFHERADFRGFLFPKHVDFTEAEFSKGASFESARFSMQAIFNSVRFSEDASFRDAKFDNRAVFNKANFENNAVFSGATFAAAASFDHSSFEKGCAFRGASFQRAVSFVQVNFFQEVSFAESSLGGGARVDKLNRIQVVNFRQASFEGQAYFSDTVFNLDTSFIGSKFREEVSYYEAIFREDAYFGDSVFERDAYFQKATFHHTASFNQARFSGFARFQGVVFIGKARNTSGSSSPTTEIDFSDAQFEKPTSFRGADFQRVHPTISGAIFHVQTDFSCRDNTWPRREQHDIRLARECYAAIRHLMARQGRPEDEHYFFRREMRFAAQSGSYFERVPYLIYGVLSDYGYSIFRPFVSLVLLWFLPSLLYAVAFSRQNLHNSISFQIHEAFGISFANTFNFLGLLRTFFDTANIQLLPAWIQLFCALQTVLGFVFLFFLGLGLRTRFRLR